MVHQWGEEGKIINEEQDKRIIAEFERKRNENSFKEKQTTFPTTISTSPSTTSKSIMISSATLPVDIPSLDNTIQTNYDSEGYRSSTKRPVEVSTSLSVSVSVSNETARRIVDVSKSKSSTSYPAPSIYEITTVEPFVPAEEARSEMIPAEVPRLEGCTLPEIPENAKATVADCEEVPEKLRLGKITDAYETNINCTSLKQYDQRVSGYIQLKVSLLGICRSSPLAYFCKDSSKIVPPGIVVQYECEAGYLLFGPPAITCRKDGSWSAKPPECDPSKMQLLGKSQLAPLFTILLNLLICIILIRY
jgi:hypothetical protein